MKKSLLSFLVAFALIMALVQPAQASEATPLNSTISKLLGVRYLAGGTTQRGFDCSGFTSFVFAQFKIDLPHQSGSQAQLGVKVLKNNLRPGDLVFFNTNGRGISHVGIYTGNGRFAHAARQGIVVESMYSGYYSYRYVTARRILNETAFNKIATLKPLATVATVASVAPSNEESTTPVIESTTVTSTTSFDIQQYMKSSATEQAADQLISEEETDADSSI